MIFIILPYLAFLLAVVVPSAGHQLSFSYERNAIDAKIETTNVISNGIWNGNS
jgi:hypothetical protein